MPEFTPSFDVRQRVDAVMADDEIKERLRYGNGVFGIVDEQIVVKAQVTVQFENIVCNPGKEGRHIRDLFPGVVGGKPVSDPLLAGVANGFERIGPRRGDRLGRVGYPFDELRRRCRLGSRVLRTGAKNENRKQKQRKKRREPCFHLHFPSLLY